MGQSLFARLYEGLDIGGNYQPVVEYFEFTNIKAFKAFFSENKKDAQGKTKTANSLFRAGKYKEAKKEYSAALAKWKELQKAIKQVEEKPPGWFKSDNWAFFIPWTAAILALILLYAKESAVRYVPKYVTRDGGRGRVNGLYYGIDQAGGSRNNKSPNYSGSITKKAIMDAIQEAINYCEFQIKACDKPDGIVLEAANEVLETYIEFLTEAISAYEESAVFEQE